MPFSADGVIKSKFIKYKEKNMIKKNIKKYALFCLTAILACTIGVLAHTPLNNVKGSTISFDIDSLQIVKKAPSLTDHFQKSAAGMMILVICLKMLCKLFDPVGKNSYLYFR